MNIVNQDKYSALKQIILISKEFSFNLQKSAFQSAMLDPTMAKNKTAEMGDISATVSQTASRTETSWSEKKNKLG